MWAGTLLCHACGLLPAGDRLTPGRLSRIDAPDAPCCHKRSEADATRKNTKQRLLAAACILSVALLGAGGIWVGDADDAPGAAFPGLVLMAALPLYGCHPPALPAQKVTSSRTHRSCGNHKKSLTKCLKPSWHPDVKEGCPMKELLLAGCKLLTVLLPGAILFAAQQARLQQGGSARPDLPLWQLAAYPCGRCRNVIRRCILRFGMDPIAVQSHPVFSGHQSGRLCAQCRAVHADWAAPASALTKAESVPVRA